MSETVTPPKQHKLLIHNSIYATGSQYKMRKLKKWMSRVYELTKQEIKIQVL